MYKLTFKFLYVLYAQLYLKFCSERGIIFVYSKAVSLGHEPLAEPFRMWGLDPLVWVGMETVEC